MNNNFYKRCRDCVSLVEGENGTWVCDEACVPCSSIKKCPYVE